MKNLQIAKVKSLPLIEFDAARGLIYMEGRLISHDARSFFAPLNDWVTAYINQPAEETNVNIDLEFVSTNCYKLLLLFLKKFEMLQGLNNNVNIIWYYEDSDDEMRQMGYDFENILNLPFKFVNKILVPNYN